MLIQRTTRSVNYATAISIVILAAAITTLVGSISRTAESRRWVVHTQEVMVRLQTTISMVNEADALQKSLLLGSDPQDRSELESRLGELPREWQTLRSLTRDNPVQQQALRRYRALIDSFTQAVRQGLQVGALRRLVSRYARSHGPFTAEELSARWGVDVLPELRDLAAEGAVLEGEFRPGGAGTEWVAPDVLRRVRRRTLGGALLVQTAVPVALGLGLAIGAGALLGALLLQIANQPVALDGWMILALTGAAAAVVLLVTGLSMPVLFRAMRPDGLRTE